MTAVIRNNLPQNYMLNEGTVLDDCSSADNWIAYSNNSISLDNGIRVQSVAAGTITRTRKNTSYYCLLIIKHLFSNGIMNISVLNLKYQKMVLDALQLMVQVLKLY